MPGSQWQDGDVVLRVRVQPRASKDEMVEIIDDQVKVRIKAPPVDGKANEYLCAFLAKQFGVSKSSVELLRGESSRSKLCLIRSPRKIPELLSEELGAPPE